MELFTITCTTCQQRLKVRDESLIGEIQICPKCSSMVLVEPPPGWQRAQRGDRSDAPAEAAPPADPSPDAQEAMTVPGSPAPAAPPCSPKPPPMVAPDRASGEADRSEIAAEPPPVAEPQGPPALPGDGALPREPPPSSEPLPMPAADIPGAPEPVLPTDEWSSPGAQYRRQWLRLAGAALTGVLMAIGLFGFWVSRTAGPPPAQTVDSPQLAGADAEPQDIAPARGEASDPEPPVAEAKAPGEEPNEDGASKVSSTQAADAEKEPLQAAEAGQVARPESEPDEQAVEEPARLTGPSANHQTSPHAQEQPGAEELILVPDEEQDRPISEEAAALSQTLDVLVPLIDSRPHPVPEPAGAPADAKPPELKSEPRVPDATPSPRPEPRKVDVAERLKDKIPEIEFQDVPLVAFVRFLSGFSTIPITLDTDAVALVQATPRTPVSVHLNHATVADVLSAALGPLGLAAELSGGHLIITRPPLPGDGLRELVHPVDDLVGDDADRLAELAKLVTEMVEPASWVDAGGRGTVRCEMPSLVFRQRETVLFRAIVFCERLRAARGLEPRSKFDRAWFRLEPRWARATKMLGTPITLRYVQPIPFVRILERIHDETGLDILVDWPAVAELGWSPDAEATFSADGEPLGEALEKMLDPMDLVYRVIDGRTLQITSPAQLHRRLDVEFYPVASLLTEGQTADGLIRRIRDGLGATQLDEVGAAFGFDRPSKHLVVALPQPLHRKLAALLPVSQDTTQEHPANPSP